jgi:exodeoxyribonuclease VII large subunit
VGIVTSPTGAVIRDFLNIVSRRHSGLNVLLISGFRAGRIGAAEIEAALAELNVESGGPDRAGARRRIA